MTFILAAQESTKLIEVKSESPKQVSWSNVQFPDLKFCSLEFQLMVLDESGKIIIDGGNECRFSGHFFDKNELWASTMTIFNK